MTTTKRDCPALGEQITSLRCGQERGSRLACPPTCPSNPFNTHNRDLLLKIEKRVLQKIRLRYALEAGYEAEARLRRESDRLGRNPFLSEWASLRVFFRERDANGLTLPQRWEAADWSGLNNDEQVLLQAMSGTRLTLFEAHRQIDDLTLEGIDLLEGDETPIRLVHEPMARYWIRFGIYICWTYQAPGYRSLMAEALEVADIGQFDPITLLTAVVRHLGGPSPLTSAREWITDHLPEVIKSVRAAGDAITGEMEAGHHQWSGQAYYSWIRPDHAESQKQLRQQLRLAPDFGESRVSDEERAEGWHECWDGLLRLTAESHVMEPDPTPDQTWPRGEVMTGRVLLRSTGGMLEADSEAHFALLKRRFDSLSAGLMSFDYDDVDESDESDESDELEWSERPEPSEEAPRMGHDPALVPPELLGQTVKTAGTTMRVPIPEPSFMDRTTYLLDQHFFAWPDIPLPALQNMSPRQASADPVLRPRLVAVVKRLVCQLDAECVDAEFVYDVNWLLQDLGLEEIIFDPPYVEIMGSGADADSWDDACDPEDEGFFSETTVTQMGGRKVEMAWDYDPSRAHPPVDVRVLTPEEVKDRVRGCEHPEVTDGDTPPFFRAIDRWPTIDPLCRELGEELTQAELMSVSLDGYTLAAIMAPHPKAGAQLIPGRWAYYFGLEKEWVADLLQKNSDSMPLAAMIGDSPQPAVAEWVARIVAKAFEAEKDLNHLEGKGRIYSKLSRNSALFMLCFLRAGIREFCHVPTR